MPTWAAAFAQVFEAGMLVCFGFAWPVDILRTIRTRRVDGKSVAFMGLILLGYLSGMAAKFIRAGAAGTSPEPVTALYAFNAVMVGIDIGLCICFRRKAGR